MRHELRQSISIAPVTHVLWFGFCDGSRSKTHLIRNHEKGMTPKFMGIGKPWRNFNVKFHMNNNVQLQFTILLEEIETLLPHLIRFLRNAL